MEFASYLKQADIYTLLLSAPAKCKGKQADLFGATEGKKERKPRTSSEQVKAQQEAAQAVFKPANYEKGIDAKTGWLIRARGRSAANEALDAQMMDDARDAGYYIDVQAKELVKMNGADSMIDKAEAGIGFAEANQKVASGGKKK